MKAFTPYYVMRVGKLQVVPYYHSQRSEYCARVKRASVLTAKAFLLANHGVVVTGGSLADAVDNTEELEETAKLYFILQDKKSVI